MNTFFTVWFLLNGTWIANQHDGWVAYDRKTEAACQQSVKFSRESETTFIPKGVTARFSCEKDDKPKKQQAV